MRRLFLLALAACLASSGCDRGVNQRLSTLEKKVEILAGSVKSLEEKHEEKYTVEITRQEEAPTVAAESSAEAMTDFDIQTALKNAGLYKGAIDGKIGPNTIIAIREFQRANGLKPDGIVGAKTRVLLQKHLTKQGD